ncbi:hypothetical protein LOD99_5430 [Oopsacas minuta]|uniref:BED-type domain-containing protein n=1 Tax=Oopsacas minuta TaxID=111878 RepID=A0AAV7JRB6_9METZ|nr:hypothetical protein LOD99_5430 [Oopsacas minuta]
MAQGGRPIDSVCKFFIKVEDGGKIRAKCIKCSAMISAKAGKLRTHLEKCSQSQLKNNFPKDDLPEILVPFNSGDTTIPPEKCVCHKIIQSKLNDFTIKTSSHQKEILDNQIARLFYACNLPFNLAENDVFKKTISILRPGYTPPTRKSLAGGLLDKTFNEVTTMTASALEGKDVTLVQDGWSDIHNSQPFLLNILAQHEDVIDLSIANQINNVGLYRGAKNLYDQLKPIATSLDKLQGEKSNVAGSCEEWMKLIQLDELTSHLGKIQKRFKQATTPTHFLANMINPKYMGQRLSCEQQEEARGLLIQLNASLLPQLYQFQAKEPPFPASIFECTDALNPVTWWKAIKKSKNLVADEFCDLAINLLILPSSSASIEGFSRILV